MTLSRMFSISSNFDSAFFSASTGSLSSLSISSLNSRILSRILSSSARSSPDNEHKPHLQVSISFIYIFSFFSVGCPIQMIQTFSSFIFLCISCQQTIINYKWYSKEMLQFLSQNQPALEISVLLDLIYPLLPECNINIYVSTYI